MNSAIPPDASVVSGPASLPAESRYRKLLETMCEFVAELLPDGTFRDASKIFTEDTGYTAEELIGTNFFSYVHPDDAPETLRHCEALIGQGKPIRNCAYRFRKKNGTYMHLLSNGEPLYDSKGKLDSVLQVSFNVTAQKETEAALRESQERHDEAQRLARLGHWTLNLADNHLSWSDEVFRIFEIDPAHFGASYEAFLDLVHPDDRGFVNQAYTDSVENKTGYDIVHRLLFEDGRIKYAHERCQTHYDENGAPLYSIGTVQDITERRLAEIALERHEAELGEQVKARTAELSAKNAELSKSKEALVSLLEDVNDSRAALEKANARLEELDRLKSMFIASMSHELRTPLNSIIGFTGIILQGMSGEITADQQDQLRRVYGAAKHLLELITEIIDISKIEAGKVGVYPTRFALHAL
ncbi:MAG: PAS domain-containing protein, partial [Nitrospiria bacterium]